MLYILEVPVCFWYLAHSIKGIPIGNGLISGIEQNQTNSYFKQRITYWCQTFGICFLPVPISQLSWITGNNLSLAQTSTWVPCFVVNVYKDARGYV